MKRMIYEPAEGEEIPDAKATITYVLPVASVTVYDCIVDDSFTTSGTVYYDSTIVTPEVFDANGDLVAAKVIAKELSETPIHHFAGWEF
jgi:hypothetical protein